VSENSKEDLSGVLHSADGLLEHDLDPSGIARFFLKVLLVELFSSTHTLPGFFYNWYKVLLDTKKKKLRVTVLRSFLIRRNDRGNLLDDSILPIQFCNITFSLSVSSKSYCPIPMAFIVVE